MKKTIISFLFLFVCGMAHSQVLAKGPEESYNADSIRAILDKSPYFTLSFLAIHAKGFLECLSRVLADARLEF